MTSFQKILQACRKLKLPAYPDFSTQGEDTYVVYNVAGETPTCFGDDTPESTIVDLQVHLYLPAEKNFFDIKNKLCKSLFAQGFTYPSIPLNKVEDTTTRHIVFEFEDDVSV